MPETIAFKRAIRSFVRREGRMTSSQKTGLENLMEKYGVCIEDGSIEKLLKTEKLVRLEIGFGMGEGLFEMARANPDKLYLGIEVHRPGVGRLLNQIEESKLENIKVCMQDATEVLKQCVSDSSLDRVQIFFPDPWPKKKHHKRRIVQPDFMALLAVKLTAEGLIHLATDWQDYYEHMVEVVSKVQSLSMAPDRIQAQLRQERPASRFEQRGIRLGHAIYDIALNKTAQH